MPEVIAAYHYIIISLQHLIYFRYWGKKEGMSKGIFFFIIIRFYINILKVERAYSFIKKKINVSKAK
jgi:hypothetical protein